jgi:hypothetical protein
LKLYTRHIFGLSTGNLDFLIGQPQKGDDAEEPYPGSYSTDQGNVTQVCPGFHPIYNIPIQNGQSNHTKEFTAAAITEEAYQATLLSAKGMAGAAWKMLTDDAFAQTVKAEYDEHKAGQQNSGA